MFGEIFHHHQYTPIMSHGQWQHSYKVYTPSVAQAHDRKKMHLWSKGIKKSSNPITHNAPYHELLDLHVHSLPPILSL
jgi:hypothetical protein